jgi:hypothetical protein
VRGVKADGGSDEALTSNVHTNPFCLYLVAAELIANNDGA